MLSLRTPEHGRRAAELELKGGCLAILSGLNLTCGPFVIARLLCRVSGSCNEGHLYAKKLQYLLIGCEFDLSLIIIVEFIP